MTDRYAVIGNPVAHSKSPLLQKAFAEQTGQNIGYDKILAPIDGFAKTVRHFQDEGGKGMNVTVPFKVEAYELADELTPRAQAAGAVNTLVFREDGTILGDNTDGCGIVRDISRNLGCSFAGQRVLLLGAGGAVRGALLPILAEKPAEVFIANRTAAKAVDLARQFAELVGATTLHGGGFDEITGSFDIVINGTASGLTDEAPPLPGTVWGNHSLAYDMFYANEPTAFMRAAIDAGALKVSDGLGMLVEQGAESFFLWRDVRPTTEPVIRKLRAG